MKEGIVLMQAPPADMTTGGGSTTPEKPILITIPPQPNPADNNIYVVDNGRNEPPQLDPSSQTPDPFSRHNDPFGDIPMDDDV